MLETTRRSRLLDPLNPVSLSRLIDDLVYAGHYDEARSMIAQTEGPDFPELGRRAEWNANLLAEMAYDEGDIDGVYAELDNVEPLQRTIWLARLAHDEGDEVEIGSDSGRVEAYADWMTSPDNPRFTTVIANRLWKKAMGRGMFEPVDELMDSTEPALSLIHI